MTRFLLSEMSKPVDVSRIAALADTRETAAELYIASAMVVDMDDPVERTYLDKLALAMNLDASVGPSTGGTIESLVRPVSTRSPT